MTRPPLSQQEQPQSSQEQPLSSENNRTTSETVTNNDFTRSDISPLERQWSENNISYGSVVPGFGTSSDAASSVPLPPMSTPETLHSSMSNNLTADMDNNPGDIRPLLARAGSYKTNNGTQTNLVSGGENDNLVTSAIHDAARITNWRTVLSLCKSHPNSAQYAGPDGWTALHHACNRRIPHADVAEALIEAYPDALLETEEKGMTPLHYACRFKAPRDVVRLLLHMYPNRGHAAVLLRDKKGRTPLFYAVRYDAPPGVVEMLLDVDPRVVLDEDRNAESPIALVWDTWVEKSEGRRALAPFLFPETNDMVDGADSASAVDDEIVTSRVLLDKLQSPQNKKLRDKWNKINLFLRAAFGFNKVDIVQGENDTTSSELGSSETRKWRVLHATAAIKCHPSLFMLARALYPEQATEFDENDLYGPKEGVTSSHQTALHLAASSAANGDLAIVSTLLKLYPDAAQISDGIDGSLPLHLMVENERKMQWVQDGLRDVYNIFPNAAKTPDNLGRLPLHRATAISHQMLSTKTHWSEAESIICNLVEAYPEACSLVDESGRLPLHYFAENGEVWDDEANAILNTHPAAARTRAGKNLHNRLPIHIASASPDARRSLIERLVELNPRGVSQQDGKNKLPLHLACETGKQWDKGVSAIYEAYPAAIREVEGNDRRWMALHLAASSPNATAELIEKLAEFFPQAASEVDCDKRYPLHLASSAGKSWVGGLKAIFDANPDAIRAEDSFGLLPFHVAAFRFSSLSAERKDEVEDIPMLRPSIISSRITSRASTERIEADEETAKLDVLFNLLRIDPTVLE